MMVHKMPCYGP